MERIAKKTGRDLSKTMPVEANERGKNKHQIYLSIEPQNEKRNKKYFGERFLKGNV